MNAKILPLFGMVLSPAVLALQTQITLKVVDDTGVAVKGATAGVTLCESKRPGEGWGCDTKAVNGLTDAEGLVTVQGSSDSGPLGVHAKKVGYYPTGQRIDFKGTTWSLWPPWDPRRIEPWNPTITLELKKILNPIPLYARKVEFGNEKALPVDGRKRAFDLQRGDWVTPYGEGTHPDFVFELVSKHETEDKYEATLTLSFSNEGDGIVPMMALPHQGSRLRLSRYAPESGYEPRLTEHVYRDRERPEGQRFDTGILENQNYFFRVRTIKDSSGIVQRALYGKVHGDIGFGSTGYLWFTYYFNPNFNDRNLEFDPQRNLFTNLTSLENVSDP